MRADTLGVLRLRIRDVAAELLRAAGRAKRERVGSLLRAAGRRTASFWTRRRGRGVHVERVVEVDSQVKIFGLGKVAEKFLEQQLRATYGAAAEFTNRWIAEKGLAP